MAQPMPPPPPQVQTRNVVVTTDGSGGEDSDSASIGTGSSGGSGSGRSVVKIGAIGFLGLSLSLTDLFRMQAASAEGANGAKAKSVILLWMDGGPSH